MSLCKEGKTSLLSFLCGCSISIAYLCLQLFGPLSFLKSIQTITVLSLIAANGVLLTVLFRTHSNLYQETVHQFKQGKRRTSHQKGVAPEAALKRRRGPVDVDYIEDYHKRKQTQSNRLPSLWKKAKEVAIMTGVALRLQVRDEYYDSVECGHAKEEPYKVAKRGCFLGLMFGIGLVISLSGTTFTHFGWYLIALCFFHWSEYFTTALTNPSSLSLESYLLDHSREYKLAAIASWTEFFIEWFIFPGLKQFHYLSICGLLLVIVGEVIRKSSMFTAKTNFNHYVQYVKQRGHQLVTTGIYSLCRHPSYMGWFLWSIGTQVLLCNPCCLVGYTYVSWRFFKDRIFEEEIYLLNFFGEDYVKYQSKVGTGLPFIYGCRGHFE